MNVEFAEDNEDVLVFVLTVICTRNKWKSRISWRERSKRATCDCRCYVSCDTVSWQYHSSLMFDFCTSENCLTELVGFKIASHVTQYWLSHVFVAEEIVCHLPSLMLEVCHSSRELSMWIYLHDIDVLCGVIICIVNLFIFIACAFFVVFVTALHGMQTRSSDENSVCPSVRLSVWLSVRPSVHHTRELWQNARKICPDLYTIRKNI